MSKDIVMAFRAPATDHSCICMNNPSKATHFFRRNRVIFSLPFVSFGHLEKNGNAGANAII